MTNTSSRLLRQSSLYALGNVALKASGLLLAVLYLNPTYLSVADFGYFSLLIVTSQLGIFLVGLGIGTGLLKFMADPEYREDRDALPFTALVATAVVAVLALGVFWLLARPLASLMLDDAAQTGLIYLLAIYVVLKVVSAIPMMLLRVQERAGWYIVAMVAEVLVLIAAAYVLMVAQGLGLWGLMAAYALSAGVGTVVLVTVMLVLVPWRFERRLVQVLARFGMPLVIASFAGWFLNAGDRYLLKWLTDAATVGLYEWAARLAGVLNMLFVQSFNLAFSVIGLKALGTNATDGQMHRQALRHYVVWTGWAVLGLSLISYDLTRLLPADPVYLQADALVLLLALGFMNYGIYYVIINVVYATGRTGVISFNVLGAALLNAGLNIALIPWLGVLGASLATVVAYLALALGAAYFTKGDVEVRFPWRPFLIVVSLIVGLYWLGRPSIGWSFGGRVAIRAALVVAYPLLILMTRLYSRAEVRGVWQAVRKR